MPSSFLKAQSRFFEVLFQENNQELLEELRGRMARAALRIQLSHVSGICDESLLDRLIDLEIGPETLAAISIVPLVCVAWADREVQAEEMEVILAAAREAGIQSREGHYPLLEQWLKKRPSHSLIEAWKHYIREIGQRLNPPEMALLKHGLLDLAGKVAGASGRVLGVGSGVSKVEQAVLDELEKAFS